MAYDKYAPWTLESWKRLAASTPTRAADSESTARPITQQDIDDAKRVVKAMEDSGVNYSFQLYGLNEPSSEGGSLFQQAVKFVTNPAVLTLAGGLAGVAAGGGAAAAGAGSGGTAATDLGALNAAGGSAANTGLGVAGGAGGAAGTAGIAGAAAGGGAGATGATAVPLGSGISTGGTGASIGGGALGTGITAGAAPAGGGGVASSGGFLGLSTGDWVNLGTQLGGAMLQADAAKSAAAGQTAASDAAIAESRRQYDTTRSDLMPWLRAGTGAIGRLSDLVGTSGTQLTPEQVMQMDPGYQFRLVEGTKAIGNLAGARGMTNSGATLKALTRFGQDYASNEYGNIYNRLAGIAGTGQQAGTTLGGLGAQNAGTIGQYMTGAANARGAAGIGAANAYGGALNTIGNYYSQNQMLDKILKNRSGTGLYGGY